MQANNMSMEDKAWGLIYDAVLRVVDYRGNIKAGSSVYSPDFSPNNIRKLIVSPDGVIAFYHISVDGYGKVRTSSFKPELLRSAQQSELYQPLFSVLYADRICASIEEVIIIPKSNSGESCFYYEKDTNASGLIKSYKKSDGSTDTNKLIESRYKRLYAFSIYAGTLDEFKRNLSTTKIQPNTMFCEQDWFGASAIKSYFHKDDWYTGYGSSASFYVMDAVGGKLNSHFKTVAEKMAFLEKESRYRKSAEDYTNDIDEFKKTVKDFEIFLTVSGSVYTQTKTAQDVIPLFSGITKLQPEITRTSLIDLRKMGVKELDSYYKKLEPFFVFVDPTERTVTSCTKIVTTEIKYKIRSMFLDLYTKYLTFIGELMSVNRPVAVALLKHDLVLLDMPDLVRVYETYSFQDYVSIGNVKLNFERLKETTSSISNTIKDCVLLRSSGKVKTFADVYGSDEEYYGKILQYSTKSGMSASEVASLMFSIQYIVYMHELELAQGNTVVEHNLQGTCFVTYKDTLDSFTVYKVGSVESNDSYTVFRNRLNTENFRDVIDAVFADALSIDRGTDISLSGLLHRGEYTSVCKDLNIPLSEEIHINNTLKEDTYLDRFLSNALGVDDDVSLKELIELVESKKETLHENSEALKYYDIKADLKVLLPHEIESKLKLDALRCCDFSNTKSELMSKYSLTDDTMVSSYKRTLDVYDYLVQLRMIVSKFHSVYLKDLPQFCALCVKCRALLKASGKDALPVRFIDVNDMPISGLRDLCDSDGIVKGTYGFRKGKNVYTDSVEFLFRTDRQVNVSDIKSYLNVLYTIYAQAFYN